MSFRLDPAFEREFRKTPEYRAALRAHQELVRQRAEAIAPRGTSHRGYAERFVIDGDALGNTDFAAHLVEWGWRNHPPYAVLRRAVRAAGLSLREEPK